MNSSWLSVDPVFPIWVVVVILLPCFVFFIYKEIKRPARFLGLRIVAQVLILIALLGICLRPAYRQERTFQGILLLTPGFGKARADSLARISPELTIYRTGEAESYPGAEVMPYYDFESLGNSIKIVLGEGLTADQLGLIDQKNFQFVPAKLPNGVSGLFLPTPIKVNQRHVLQGVFNAHGKATIKLVGPGEAVDSVTIQGTGNVPFAIPFKSKQAGRFVYSLVIKIDSSDEFTERLPIEIIEERKLNILFLQKFPTAEVRYLKNYLGERRHSLALRYQTSKQTYRYEYVNLNPIKADRLTPDLIAQFDLIFIDSDVLANLSSMETTFLENSVVDGLGVVTLLNELPAKSGLNRLMPLKTNRLTTDTVHVRFSGSKVYTLPALPLEVVPTPSIQPVTKDGSRILSGYTYLGFGKVAFQLLTETYRIGLEGNQDDYSQIWSPLIERTSRGSDAVFKIKLKSQFPIYQDEPLFPEIISSGPKPLFYTDKTRLPLTEDVVIDDLWWGQSWADEPGWHQFLIEQDSTQLNYYVSEKGAWRTLRLANQMKENELAQSPASAVVPAETKYESRTLPLLLYYLIFLICSGFLWLAPKI